MSLLAPLGLLALAALALPLLIHLVRRSERREVVFAALRWIGERNRPRQQLRLHDRLLLALRLLLLVAVALLLALPARARHGAPGSAWVLVSPEVASGAARAALPASAAEWRWLAPDFPLIDTPQPQSAPPASLIREADARLPPETALRIVVPQALDQLDAERLRLAHAVDWVSVAGGAPVETPSSAPPPLRLAIRGDGAHEDERRVIRALAASWRAAGREVTLDEAAAPLSPETTLLFWLGGAPDAAATQWIGNGGRVLVTAQASPAGVVALTADDGQPLVFDESVGRGHRFNLVTTLIPGAMPALLDPQFPAHLLDAIEPRPSPVSFAAAAAVAPVKIEPAPPAPMQPLTPWVAVLAAALFLLERLCAAWLRPVLP